jgi:hypothetical protein
MVQEYRNAVWIAGNLIREDPVGVRNLDLLRGLKFLTHRILLSRLGAEDWSVDLNLNSLRPMVSVVSDAP